MVVSLNSRLESNKEQEEDPQEAHFCVVEPHLRFADVRLEFRGNIYAQIKSAKRR